MAEPNDPSPPNDPPILDYRAPEAVGGRTKAIQCFHGLAASISVTIVTFVLVVLNAVQNLHGS